MNRAMLPLLLVSLVLVPGCSSRADEPDFLYGEVDMRAVVAGDWVGTMRPDGAPETTVTLQLHQPITVLRPACANREFLHTTCINISSMQLEGALSSADGKFANTTVRGSFSVPSRLLTTGDLTLEFGGQRAVLPYSESGFGEGSLIVENRRTGSLRIARR